jgi:hypothetical protein
MLLTPPTPLPHAVPASNPPPVPPPAVTADPIVTPSLPRAVPIVAASV